MFKAVKRRNKWIVLLLAVFIQPALAMFYLNRPMWGGIYLVLAIIMYPLSSYIGDFKFETAPTEEALPLAVLSIVLFLIYIVMALHCFLTARKFTPQERMPWYTGVAYVLSLILFILLLLVPVFAIFVRSLAYQPFNIPSGSMRPNLMPGDYLLAEKYAYGYSRYSLPFNAPLIVGKIFSGKPKRGDVVIFKKPKNVMVDYVKRIVGLPGDTIQIKGGVLYINNVPVSQKPAGTYYVEDLGRAVERLEETLPNGVSYYVLNYSDGSYGDNTSAYKVPVGHYFVLGDNRDNALDSRSRAVLGFIPEELIIARVSNIFWSGKTKFFSSRKMYLEPKKE